MPFLTQCPFCNQRARVPDRANGSVGKCPKCSNSFTLAPSEDQKEPELVAAPAGEPSSSDLERATSASAPAAAASMAAETDLLPSSPETSPTLTAVPEAICAALGLFLAGCSWAFAPFAATTFLALPFAGLALLISLVAMCMALFSGRKRLILPGVSCSLSALLLGMLFFAPAFFGPAFERSRLSAPQATGIQAIPLNNAPILTQVPEWTDASQYALQEKGVTVRVVSVHLGPAPGAETKPKAPQEKLLNIRIRVTLREHTAGKDAKTFDWSDDRRPQLTGAAGQSIKFREALAFAPIGAKRRSDLFPVHTTEEVFVFETPPPGWDALKLQVPAAALGGTGMFRFTIPAAMVGAPPIEGTQSKNTK